MPYVEGFVAPVPAVNKEAYRMEDPRMQADWTNMPFDGHRMIYGGFTPILDA